MASTRSEGRWQRRSVAGVAALLTMVAAWDAALSGAHRTTAIIVLGAAASAVALRLTARDARSGGRSAAAADERARTLRLLHDTVLHTLETMARRSELDSAAPETTLVELRRAARRQADRLRREMSELADGPAAPLTASLHGVADEFTPDGLRAQVIAALDVPDLPAQRQVVLRDGVRAALGNVLKHSGVDRAVVRVEAADVGVRVIVRDNGRGFDPARNVPGFGMRQSIDARLREAGGRATLTSSPGRGTRVELWVPC